MGIGSNERPTQLGRKELTIYFMSCLLQVVGICAVPFYLYFQMKTTFSLALLCFLSSISLSIAWFPPLHQLMRDRLQQEVRPIYHPYSPKTARVKAYLVNSALRMLFTVIYLVVYTHAGSGRMFTGNIGDLLRAFSSSSQLWPFVIHIITAFVGYNAARLALLLTFQRFAFAIPLFLSTPVALAVFLGWANFPFLSLVSILSLKFFSVFAFNFSPQPSDTMSNKYAVIGFNLAFWLSEVNFLPFDIEIQIAIVFRTAWNKRTPRLALDDMLFIQPSYNSVGPLCFSVSRHRSFWSSSLSSIVVLLQVSNSLKIFFMLIEDSSITFVCHVTLIRQSLKRRTTWWRTRSLRRKSCVAASSTSALPWLVPSPPSPFVSFSSP